MAIEVMVEPSSSLTAVIIAYRKNRINHRLIFGAPSFEVRRGWRRKLACFEPGQTFAYERWSANQYGTQRWQLVICRAVNSGSISPVPGVIPGADVLLNVRGKARVKRALAAISSQKKVCSVLPSVPSETWRAVHNHIHSGTFRDVSVRGKRRSLDET